MREFLPVSRATRKDYDDIVRNIEEFWGSKRTLQLHHVMYVEQLVDTSYVVKNEEKVVAYLFGFVAEAQKVGYISLIGVRDSHKRQGLGQRLYELFAEYARARGCTKLKAVTDPSNANSIAFHTAKIGMETQGVANRDGVRVVKDYAGPGEDRVVFEKTI